MIRAGDHFGLGIYFRWRLCAKSDFYIFAPQ